MIRPAMIEDVPEILAIYAPYVRQTTITFEYEVPTLQEFEDRFRTITAQFPWLVWEENGKILGYAYGSAPYARAAYSWCAEPSVYLLPDAQGKGIGRALYRVLEQILTAQGYQLMYAIITEENENSLHFHEKCGYETKVVYHNCGFKFEKWLGVIWMEKRLKSVEIPSGFPTPWSSIVNNYQKNGEILR